MHSDRDRLVEAGRLVGHAVGDRMQHGPMPEYLLGPSGPEPSRVPERPAAGHHVAVEVETARRPSSGAVGTRWIDAPGQTGDDRVDRHPRPDGERAVLAGLDDRPGDLVAQFEGEV